MRNALVTNATGYAGPPAVASLLDGGFRVFAQDATFADESAWTDFSEGREAVVRVADTDPAAIATTVLDEVEMLDALVSNDMHPARAHVPDTAPLDDLRGNLDRLVEFPYALIQAALPRLRAQERANIVMITSNRMRLPLPGSAFPDAGRSAANALVRSLAIDLAPDNITVNAVAPNFLYSEAFYPKAIFEDTAEGRDHIQRNVPASRLADPWEIGELIHFLAAARSRHLTGAVIDFSGGWPMGDPRPGA